MRVLFIGGTGTISTAVSALAIERGMDLYLLNRGHRPVPKGAKSIVADMSKGGEPEAALKGMTFDCIVNWICFQPHQMEHDLRLFSGMTGQYIFISSASAYERPVKHYLITEKTPLANPFSQYARDKIACEERLMRAHHEAGFPCTIVRPSLTFGEGMIPMAMGARAKPWTLVDRIRKGKPIVVNGDGMSLWVTTHNTDFAKGFVGLIGNKRAIGQAVHITTDEVHPWDDHYRALGEAAGAEPKIVHVATDAIIRMYPQDEATLRGDKAWSVVFDNSKIKSLVPDYRATLPLVEGLKRTIQWYETDESRRGIDEEFNLKTERLIERHGT